MRLSPYNVQEKYDYNDNFLQDKPFIYKQTETFKENPKVIITS